jgi:undecaprenyl phosphate-alpha-L-ara4FN deformylase
MAPQEVRSELDHAYESFKAIAGQPGGFATPAWLTCSEALLHQESFSLTYASDCRGTAPFFPVVEGRVLETPQVPANLATLDEVLGRPQQTVESFFDDTLERARSLLWPVFTLHAEAEGGRYAEAFSSFLARGQEQGFDFQPLTRLLEQCTNAGALPACSIERGQVPGRHGEVSVQGAAQDYDSKPS